MQVPDLGRQPHQDLAAELTVALNVGLRDISQPQNLAHLQERRREGQDQPLVGALDRRRLGQDSLLSIITISLDDQPRLLVRRVRCFALDFVDDSRLEDPRSVVAMPAVAVEADEFEHFPLGKTTDLALGGFLERRARRGYLALSG